MKLTRPLIVVAVALAAVLASLGAWWFWPRVRVDAVAVRRGPIAAYVDERAITRLPQTYLVTTPSAGRVAAVTLVEGTPVKKGQLVAQFVPLDMDLAVKEAEATAERLKAAVKQSGDTSVEEVALRQSREFVKSTADTVKAAAERVKAASARTEYAKTVLARARKLFKKDAQSQEDLDRAVLEMAQADADHAQAGFIHAAMVSIQAATNLMPEMIEKYILRKILGKDVQEKQLTEALVRLDQVKRQRELGAMTSETDGVVLHRFQSDEGYYTAGTKLLEIGNPADLEVEADLLSVDVAQVRPGYRVEVYGPAIGSTPAQGTVHRIYPAGFTKLSSLGVEQQRVKAIIRFDPAELKRLRSERGIGVGYRVRVRILSPARENALIVPRSALFRGPGRVWQLYAVRGGRLRIQDVTLGVINDDFAEVTEGLEEGNLVVLTPESTLSDRQRVTPVLRPPRSETTAASEPLQNDGD
jgi:HlyD family secretion protein